MLLIGAGGAARAVAFGLVERGAKVMVANRTHERAIRLAKELGCDSCALSEIGACEADALINTTSVGMRPNVEEIAGARVSPAEEHGGLRRGL